jgi:hypothetical protein
MILGYFLHLRIESKNMIRESKNNLRHSISLETWKRYVVRKWYLSLTVNVNRWIKI